MEEFDLYLATKSDIEDIMDFIANEWSKDHILAKSRRFFEYFYCTNGDRVNFALAKEKNSGKIVAIHGYRCCSRLEGYQDYFGALWKAKRTSFPLLGVALKRFLFQEVHARTFSGVGSNANTTIPLVKKLGYYTGKLDHYYRLSDREYYKIARIKEKCIIELGEEQRYQFYLFQSFEELEVQYNFERNKENKPYKDAEYIRHSYFNNLGFSYKVYGLKGDNSEIRSLLIGRVISINGQSVFRIVDFIGEKEELAFAGKALEDLISINNYEYADFYCIGISEKIMNSFGMIKKEGDNNIVPNYFEPFDQSNVDIYYFRDEKEKEIIICKGDADQDRPNRITWEEL